MAQKKIVISSYGSLGDLYPYLAVGKALKAKGHQVTIAGGTSARQKIEDMGLAFTPLRPELNLADKQTMKAAMDLRTGSETLARKLIFPYIRENYEDLMQAVKSADLLINHAYCFAGPIVSEKTGIPWISCNLSPNNFWSAYDSPVVPRYPWMVHLPGMGVSTNRLVRKAVRMVTHQWCEPIYQFRKEIGLSPNKHPLMEGQHSPYRVLAMFSSLMAQKQRDWPNHACITGFPFYQEHSKLPAAVEDFIQQGAPPIVVGLGSSVVLNAEEVYRCCSELLADMNQRAIFVGAAQTLTEKERALYANNKNILLTQYLPYASLFDKSALIIHHGGIGTTMEALRAGKPMLVIPHSFDQPDNALRIERLGAGKFIYSAHFTKKRLRQALQTLLENPAYAYAAQRAATIVKQESGAETASMHINSFVKQI